MLVDNIRVRTVRIAVINVPIKYVRVCVWLTAADRGRSSASFNWPAVFETSDVRQFSYTVSNSFNNTFYMERILNCKPEDLEDYYDLLGCDELSTVSSGQLGKAYLLSVKTVELRDRNIKGSAVEEHKCDIHIDT